MKAIRYIIQILQLFRLGEVLYNYTSTVDNGLAERSHQTGGARFQIMDKCDSNGNNNYVISMNNCGNVQIGHGNTLNYGRNTGNTSDAYEGEAEQPNVMYDIKSEGFDLAPFVGRQTEREKIKTELTTGKRRFVQLYGQTMVGKRRLAQQALTELLTEKSEKSGKPPSFLHIPCAGVTSLDEFFQIFVEICKLEINTKLSIPVRHCSIFTHFKDSLDFTAPTILITNCEQFLNRKVNCGKQFQNFIIDLLTNCLNTRLVVTSQTCFSFETKSMDIHVSEFSDQDTCSLLQRILPGIDTAVYSEVVTDRCYGLPPFILDAASLIRDNHNSDNFTNDLRYLLKDEVRSRRIHEHQIGGDAELSDFFPGLTDYLQQKVLDLSIFRGSFGWESINAVLSSKNGQDFPQVKYDITSLCKNSMLTKVNKPGTIRMRIQPIVESYLRNVLDGRVTYNDVVRLKFVTFFGDVLTRANTELYLKSQQTVYGYLKDDWLNLEQVLKEAIHCTENTYQSFLQVAVGADNLLINSFSSEALDFYQTMTSVTERFGSSRDVAVLRAKLGRVLTVTTGADMDRALILFKQALNVLKDTGASKVLVSLLKDISYNHYKSGKYQEAVRYCTKALVTTKDLEVDSELINQIITIRSTLAIPHIFLGEFKKAEDLLLESLELAYSHTPHHPAIYIMINSLGVLYERSTQDDDLALKYYRASLFERRKYEKMVPADLIISLNNVGMQYSKRGKHKQGLEYLEEGYRICKRLDSMHFNTALTLWHMGRVNVLLGNSERAFEHLKEALKIFNVCAKYHGVHMHVRLVLCHCYVALQNMTEARNCLKESLSFSNYFIDQTPKHEHYLLALGHLITIVQSDKSFMTDLLNKFIQEAIRLINVCGESEKLSFFKRLLVRAEQYLLNLSSNQTTDVDFISDLHNMCFVCTDMNKAGYNSNYLWREASSVSANEAALKERLVNSPAVQSCLIDHQNRYRSTIMKHDLILSRYEQSDKSELEFQISDEKVNQPHKCFNQSNTNYSKSNIGKRRDNCVLEELESSDSDSNGNIYETSIGDIKLISNQNRMPSEATTACNLKSGQLIFEKSNDVSLQMSNLKFRNGSNGPCSQSTGQSANLIWRSPMDAVEHDDRVDSDNRRQITK